MRERAMIPEREKRLTVRVARMMVNSVDTMVIQKIF